ncbi:MAG: GNAT family protein [Cyanobacteria bacterium P01_E01_bin.35]
MQEKIAEQKIGRSATFAIEPKTRSNLIGIIELYDLELEHGVAELSYWLALEAWGKGYMSEALPPVLDFGFKTLSLNRIQAYHMVRNLASGKVLLKNGFQLEGFLRQRVKKWNQYKDVKLYSLLRQKWQDN